MTNASSSSRLLALVFTDLTGSTALKKGLGDTRGIQLIERHHALVRTLLARTGGRDIHTAGDGFFLTFETPSAAVEFALRLQLAHAQDLELPPVRVGIHLGEVSVLTVPSGANMSIDIEGLAADIAARIEKLALPGQVLLSAAACDNARQRLPLLAFDRPVTWMAYGEYRLKGIDDPIEIHEAGFEGLSPLMAPPDSDSARRIREEAQEVATGWRPAVDLEVPGRPNWIIEKRLGEGASGEVWLARHKKTSERRIYKFCFSMNRLKSFKREVAIFRLIKDSLGDHPAIARIIDWQFDTSPYYLESEFAEGGNLTEWASESGGLANIPLADRLEVIAQVADALAAAHSVGVLHKDVKPTNIVVRSEKDRKLLRVRIIDFGIGQVLSREFLDRRGITAGGMTETGISSTSASLSGTRNYLAPEVLEGKQATTLADVYSLGVMLYQIVVGDFTRVLAPGWERDVSDPLLLEDIRSCVDGDPRHRIASAAELAHRLRSLEDRRQQRRIEEEARASAAKAKEVEQVFERRRRRFALLLGTAAILIAAILIFAVRENRRAENETSLRRIADEQKRVAGIATEQANRDRAEAYEARKRAEQTQYYSAVAFAAGYLRDGRIAKGRQTLLQDLPLTERQWEWGLTLAQLSRERMTLVRSSRQNEILSVRFNRDGTQIAVGNRRGELAFYDPRDGKLLRTIKAHDEGVWAIRFTPDGKSVFTTSFDKTAALWDLATGNPIYRLTGHTDLLRGAAISPDGKIVVTTSRDRTARVWELETGKFLYERAVLGAPLYDVDFRPGTREGALGGRNYTSIIDFDTSRVLARLPNQPENVMSLRYSPDGSLLALACTDRYVRVFDTRDYKLVSELNQKTGWPQCAIFTPDGKLLVVFTNDGITKYWNPRTGEEVAAFQSEQPTFIGDFDPTGRQLAIACEEAAHVIDAGEWTNVPSLVTDTQVKELLAAKANPIRTRVIAIPSELGKSWWSYDREWENSAGYTLIRAGGQVLRVESYYSSFSPDLRYRFRTESDSWKSTLTDLVEQKTLLKLESGRVYFSQFSPTGEKLALTDANGRCTVYSVPGATVLHEFAPAASSRYLSSAWSPDGRLLALGDDRGTLRLMDADAATTVQSITPARGARIYAISFSKDGSRLAFGGTDARTLIVDVASGHVVSSLYGHARSLHSATFSDDGRRLITTAFDDRVKLWDVDSGREILDLFEFPGNEVLLAAGFLPGTSGCFAVTSRRDIVIATASFPWRDDALPGAPTDPLETRLELFKRSLRAQQALPMPISEALLQRRIPRVSSSRSPASR